MNSKRLLSLVVAVCLMISVLAPAASAVQITASESIGAIQEETHSSGSNWLSSLIASAADALGIKTIRDDTSHIVNGTNKLNLVNGQWVATAVDGTSVILTDAELPDYIQALREAASHYAEDELVPAFVVLEKDPTAEKYSSIGDVPAKTTAAMAADQDELIAAIEEDVLQGGDLEVVAQFTYLTNAVVVQTQFGNLEQIAAMDGVKSVFISPVYSVCETTDVMYPSTVSSTQMSAVSDVWQNLGYTGAGMTIAILDTGLDLDHPSFAADPAMTDRSWTQEDVQAMLDRYDLNAEAEYVGTLTSGHLYFSAKVPFIFNYSSGTTNVSHADGIGDHGTHVAGISAANDLEGSGVVGMAPDAQIIVMKVFDSSTGGANMYDILEAMEDCMTMGVDVVNMSLGTQAGFCSTGIEEIDSVFERIAETDIIVDVAAGNEATSSYGSNYGYYMQPTTYIDNATISSPSTYINAMSIGSVNNAYVYSSYFTIGDGSSMFYMQSVEYLYEYIDFSLESLAGQEYEYVIVPGLGEEADFYDENGNSIVEGKIAVVSRGDITFSAKAFNAENAGAVAVMIWDNVTEDIFVFGMTTTDEDGNIPGIPVVLITLEDGQILADAEVKTIAPAEDTAPRYDAGGGQMSSFSCWGVSPNLSLLPDLTGVGGNVYSCYDGGFYGLMSGTSMATPQVAGVTALVLQYLMEVFPDASQSEIRVLVDSLMMSTAVPVISSDTGLEASPRQQGAGLVNALASVTAEAYLTVAGSDRPKAELGDSEDGTYSFTFTVHNFSGETRTYTLSASLLCEDYVTDEMYPDVYFMAEYDHALDSSAVTFSSETVTVAAGGTADVTVTIALTDADKEWIDTYFPSGNYAEGFVYLTAEDEATLSLPFLGFYGQWDAAPLFDTGYWYENGVWADDYEGEESEDESGEEEVPEIEANEYYHIIWTSLGSSTNEWILGFNPYTGATYDENGDVIYDEVNNILSPNGDGALDQITDYYVSLMRNAEYLYFTYTDEDGNVLDVDIVDHISKTMYNAGYGVNVPFVYSWYYDTLYDFTDAEGNYLPHGSKVYLTISGTIEFEGAQEQVMCTVPITIDSIAPELDEENIVETTDETGNYLTLTFEEEHPAYVAIMNFTGTQVYRTYSDADITCVDGKCTITVDVTGLGDSFMVALCDYGCNETYYELTYTLTDNMPEVSEDTLYAYQVYNEAIFYYYGWDYIFGWTTMDKQTGEITMITSDIYEYYALSAAEYAGGYVFAVDAGYNLLYMLPGLFDRHLICNLGVNVLDMAFDEVTQTMYLTTKTTASSGEDLCALYTVDLLTGDLTLLREYRSAYDMPWAITFVDGVLYAAPYYYNGFCTVDIEGGTYDLQYLTDDDGNKIVLSDSYGNLTSPGYSQSMTYSPKDGLIYWAYYNTSSYHLISIDPTDWTYTAVPFDNDQEYIGLLTVEDDGYVLPESSQATRIVLSDDQLILAAGKTASLSAATLPWNAPVGEILWASSDESVATVDQKGNVTAVGAGEAVITVTCDGLTAGCAVAVVEAKGTLYAYNFYSGDGTYGTFKSVDLYDLTLEDAFASPVDFIAADYNGHDGKIYGFDEFGQCYWFDPATGEYDTLGSGGLTPGDMAYDYSTGLMYAVVYDYTSWTSTLYCLSLHTGRLVEVGTMNDVFLTLACSTDGQLYGINYYGKLFRLDQTGSGYLQITELVDTGVGELYYAQSICYDHVNDVILFANTETATIYWIDPYAEVPFCLPLGDPTGYGTFEYVGLYTLPETITELEYTPVTGIEAEDMLVLVGSEVEPEVTVFPLNATNQSQIKYTCTKSSVVKIVDGKLVGVGPGTATVIATLTDNGKTYRTTFTVTVLGSTDNIYGYLVSDIGTYDGYYWISINDADTRNYQGVEYVYHNELYMLLYSAEYVDGTIYAYGYDPNDWNANFYFMTIDAKTWSVTSAIDMGDGFSFVYDMAFDYTTGIMYALAGPSDTATDLFYVDLATGELIECMLTDPMFMSLAIDDKGTIYAMESSATSGGELDEAAGIAPAVLYTIDVESGTYEPILDTGVYSNMLASMAYDFDSGCLYWTALLSTSTGYQSGLYMIEPEAGKVYNLGKIGSAGAQVTGLMIIADEYPEVPTDLNKIVMRSSSVEVNVGSTAKASYFTLPVGLDVDVTWSVADESIATVDGNGVVTGVSSGVTTVTATTVVDGKTFTAESKIIVYGENDYFISYNWIYNGFNSVGRPDSTVLGTLTEGETEAKLRSMEMVDGVIYAYDTEGNFFTTSAADGFKRTYLGSHGIELDEPYSEINTLYHTTYYYTPSFTARDMAWDAANERMLVLGSLYVEVHSVYDNGEYQAENDYELELSNGCRLYEMDMQTGALTELCVIGGQYGDSGVYTLAVDNAGNAYVYSTFLDYICHLDTVTGETTNISTFQNQGVYGASDGEPMAMAYDPETNCIYVMLTSNGESYNLYKFNLGTYAISLVGSVGSGSDAFAGLVVNKGYAYTPDEPDQPDVPVVPVVPSGIMGDVNGDTWVDAEDAALIMQYEVGLVDETNLDVNVADVNGDGWIDAEDAALIMQFEVGIIDKFE